MSEEIHQAIRPIVLGVSEFWQVTPEEIMGCRQLRRIVRARHACYWLAKRSIPSISYPDLARLFRRVEHTQVMYGIERTTALLGAGDKDVTALIFNWAPGVPVGMAAE